MAPEKKTTGMPAPDWIAHRFRRSAATYAAAATVQRVMAEQVVELISQLAATAHFGRIFEIGCGADGGLTRFLAERFSWDELVLNDLVPGGAKWVETLPDCRFLEGNVEELALPEALDLTAANAVFQWLRDPERLLRRIAERTVPGGLLIFSVFGPRNFAEPAALTGAGLHYPEPAVWEERLRRHFEQEARHEEILQLRFDSPEEVLRHIRATGVSAPGAGGRWTRGRLRDFCHAYRERFGTADGGVTLTYHPLILAGRRTADLR